MVYDCTFQSTNYVASYNVTTDHIIISFLHLMNPFYLECSNLTLVTILKVIENSIRNVRCKYCQNVNLFLQVVELNI